MRLCFGAPVRGRYVYYDDMYFDQVRPAYLTNVTSLNNVILVTNTSFSFTVASPANEITKYSGYCDNAWI